MSILNYEIKVNTVMLPMGKFPVVGKRTILKEALEAMTQHGMGIVCITDDNGHLEGIVTDGDIRRKLLKVQKPFSAFLIDDALEHAIKQPLTIHQDELLVNAVKVMDERKIWDLPVTNGGKLVGMLHLHPAVDYLLNIIS